MKWPTNSSSALPKKWLVSGDTVRVMEGPFSGIEGVFQMSDPEGRALVLIEMLSKPVRLSVAPSGLRRVA